MRATPPSRVHTVLDRHKWGKPPVLRWDTYTTFALITTAGMTPNDNPTIITLRANFNFRLNTHFISEAV